MSKETSRYAIATISVISIEKGITMRAECTIGFVDTQAPYPKWINRFNYSFPEDFDLVKDGIKSFVTMSLPHNQPENPKTI